MTAPERIIWREVEQRLRPIDSGLVVLANTGIHELGPFADTRALEERLRKDLTEFCVWWLRGHEETPWKH